MGVGVLGDQALASGGDRREVDVVPVHGGWGSQALESGVEPGAQVEPDRVRVAGQERRRHLVQLPGPEGDAEDEVGLDAEVAVVVVGGADDLVRRGVAEDGCGRRLSSALAYRVRNRLSSSGVKAGSVTDMATSLVW
jgi:hypothetical protein